MDKSRQERLALSLMEGTRKPRNDLEMIWSEEIRKLRKKIKSLEKKVKTLSKEIAEKKVLLNDWERYFYRTDKLNRERCAACADGPRKVLASYRPDVTAESDRSPQDH